MGRGLPKAGKDIRIHIQVTFRIMIFMQLFGQRFMRQVSYQRPKDYIDPYSPLPSMPVVNERYMLLQRRRKAASSAQVHRLQRLASSEGENSRRNLRELSQPLASAPSESWAWAEVFNGDNSNSSDLISISQEPNAKAGLNLGHIERSVKVFDSAFSKDPSVSSYEVFADIGSNILASSIEY
jgi:hypothetical protein